jgi:uncharacterized FlaG/YvyC family protein
MSDDRDILDQADRLMRRNRVFVAGSRATVHAPAEPVDDLPVLTDMVTLTETEASAEPPSVPVISQATIDQRAQVLAHEFLLERLAAQRQSIEKEVVAWLDKELPHIVMYVVDGLTDQLVAQITAAVRLELMPKLQLAVEAEQESQPSQDATRN